MNNIIKTSTFLMIFTLLSSCFDEGLPRNRPDFATNNVSSTTTENETTEDKEEEGFKRPSGAIVIQPDHCICQAQKSVGLGNCDSFCQGQTSSDNVLLHFNVELTVAITEQNLGDVAGFCSTQEGEEENAGCVLQVKDENGVTSALNFNASPGQSSFSVDVGSLNTSETYRVSILETVSQATSTTVQIRKIETDSLNNIAGPLALMPVSEYTCIAREPIFDATTGALIIENANRFHFYFIPETRPEPLKASSLSSVYCHDLESSPSIPLNSPLLEESTGVFTVWNKSDPRFFDLNGNEALDINDIIEKNVKLQGSSLTETPNFFFPLEFPSGLDDGDSTIGGDDSSEQSSSSVLARMGYAMVPFIDDRTYKSYCPTRQHYYSTNPIFEAMREVIGVGTEAIYVAKQENICDHILVRQGLLSQIWFYKENGQHISPTDDTISGKKIQFYWPADTSSPYIKKSHQRTYTVVSVDELNSSSCNSTSIDNSSPQNGSGVRTNLPAHDKRIGCIPVISD